MANTAIRQDIRRQHPDYSDISARVTKWKDAYEAAAALLSRTYIPKHIFESERAYTTRISRAFTLPFMRKPITQFLAMLFSNDIVRAGNSVRDLEPFFRDATGEMASFNMYMYCASMMSMVYHKVYTFVDFSASELKEGQEITMEDLNNGEIFPSVKLYTPLDLQNWNTIPRKGFEAVIFTEQRVIENRAQTVYIYIDYDSIEEIDSTGQTLNKFDHGLGYTPVFPLTYNSENGWDGSFGAALSSVQVGVTNLISIIDEISERQAFNQLVIPDSGDIAELEHKRTDIVKAEIAAGLRTSTTLPRDDILRVISESQALTYPAGTGHPPNFISPNGGELRNIERTVKDFILEASKATGLTDHRGNVTPETAAASARVFGSSLETHEINILKTVIGYIRGSATNTDDISVYYPVPHKPIKTDWLDDADKIAAAAWASPEAKAELIKSLIKSNVDPSSIDVDTVVGGIVITETDNASTTGGAEVPASSDAATQTGGNPVVQ